MNCTYMVVQEHVEEVQAERDALQMDLRMLMAQCKSLMSEREGHPEM